MYSVALNLKLNKSVCRNWCLDSKQERLTEEDDLLQRAENAKQALWDLGVNLDTIFDDRKASDSIIQASQDLAPWKQRS